MNGIGAERLPDLWIIENPWLATRFAGALKLTLQCKRR